MDMSFSKLWEIMKTGKPGVLQSMGLQNQTQLSDWETEQQQQYMSVNNIAIFPFYPAILTINLLLKSIKEIYFLQGSVIKKKKKKNLLYFHPNPKELLGFCQDITSDVPR